MQVLLSLLKSLPLLFEFLDFLILGLLKLLEFLFLLALDIPLINSDLLDHLLVVSLQLLHSVVLLVVLLYCLIKLLNLRIDSFLHSI